MIVLGLLFEKSEFPACNWPVVAVFGVDIEALALKQKGCLNS
jgi:hypothetical protein